MEETSAHFPIGFACEIIQDLQKQFQDQFSDLDSRAEEVRLFQNPFEANVASCPEALQLELIELQASDMLRCQAKFLTSHHVRMHRIILYMPNTLI